MLVGPGAGERETRREGRGVRWECERDAGGDGTEGRRNGVESKGSKGKALDLHGTIWNVVECYLKVEVEARWSK